MKRFIINKNPQPTGEHEVHDEERCVHLPLKENRILIGYFETCREAILVAKTRWPSYDIDGCAYCTLCHSR